MNDLNINEQQLRSEIEDLKRQLAASKVAPPQKGPSSMTAVVVVLLLLGLAVAGYYLGYLPRQKRELALAAESKSDTEALASITVAHSGERSIFEVNNGPSLPRTSVSSPSQRSALRK